MTAGIVVASLVLGVFVLVFLAGVAYLFVLPCRVLSCLVPFVFCVGVVFVFYLGLLSLFCLVLWLSCLVMIFPCGRRALSFVLSCVVCRFSFCRVLRLSGFHIVSIDRSLRCSSL